MQSVDPDFYARARIRVGLEELIQEDPSPPERWMQQIWRHQRLHRDQLKTLDGQPVRILHPGFWNREAGPDFKQAVVQIGSQPACRGDVELDRAVGGWRSHRHAGNPAYRTVVLHVVWTAPGAATTPPVMAMKPFLDAPLSELTHWLETEAPGVIPANLPGRCCGPFRNANPEQIREILNQAGAVRLRRKAAQFAVRAGQMGWDQALWEGLVAALGYKHNTWPMRQLAELTPIETADSTSAPSVSESPVNGDSSAIWEARLLGLSGLLPNQLPPGDGRAAARKLWDHWWRERDAWAEHVLPAFVWRIDGVRPANHPQRRIILAARWRAGGVLSQALQAWLAEDGSASDQISRLRTLLTPPPVADDYWRDHVTLRSRTSPRPLPLLGSNRLTELAMNVVLPWLQAWAEARGQQSVLQEVGKRYFQWPAAGDNAALRLARLRLFGRSDTASVPTGAAQQGLHQILCDFCQHAGPLCDTCHFPSAIRTFVDTGHPPLSVTKNESDRHQSVH